MAYHGYIPFMCDVLDEYDNPKILEVGVDLGQTLIPILHDRLMKGKRFSYTGVDIKISDSLRAILTYIPKGPNQVVDLVQANSLQWLPEHTDKYQLVLLDGDHNYYTVKQELVDILKNLTRDGIMICDDYYGRWSERDLWYAQRPGYEGVEEATPPMDTEKHGVKPAIDEFLLEHPEWKMKTLMKGEPVVLYREEEGFE